MTDHAGVPGPGRQVYGLAVSGADDAVELAPLAEPTVDGAADLLAVRLVLSTAPPPCPPTIDGDRIAERLITGAWVHLDRKRGLAGFHGEPVRRDLITHPYLATTAIGFNRWAGREVLHAGAFEAAGRAWVVLGPSTAGKSTLMGALAAAGVPVLADDMVVTDGETVFAGPRCVDLREPFPPGVLDGPPPALRRAREGLRWRMDLPPIAPRVPLGGWFFLQWDDTPSLVPIAMSALLARLARWRSLRQLPSDPATILALAGRPGWDLRRQRDWSGLRDSVDTLLRTATAAADTEIRDTQIADTARVLQR